MYQPSGRTPAHGSVSFLLVTEHSTAYCTKPKPCSMPLLCFLLGPEPMGMEARTLYIRMQTHTPAHMYKHTHKHAERLAHCNQPQHEHPHTNTRQHVWPATDDCRNLSATHIPTVGEQLKPRFGVLLTVATATDGTAAAGQVR